MDPDYRGWLDVELQLLALEVLQLELPLGLLRSAATAEDADATAVAAVAWRGCADLARLAAQLLERPLGLRARLGLDLPDGYADALDRLDRLDWQPPAAVADSAAAASALAAARQAVDGPALDAQPQSDRVDGLVAMLQRMLQDREDAQWT